MTIPHYPKTESISFSLGKKLYDEIFECEVDPYDISESDLSPAHIQLIQSFLEGKIAESDKVLLTTSNDALDFLIKVILPENMEMWGTWSSIEGQNLLQESYKLLKDFGLDSPF